jgi:hypothetical protein
MSGIERDAAHAHCSGAVPLDVSTLTTKGDFLKESFVSRVKLWQLAYNSLAVKVYSSIQRAISIVRVLGDFHDISLRGTKPCEHLMSPVARTKPVVLGHQW